MIKLYDVMNCYGCSESPSFTGSSHRSAATKQPLLSKSASANYPQSKTLGTFQDSLAVGQEKTSAQDFAEHLLATSARCSKCFWRICHSVDMPDLQLF